MVFRVVTWIITVIIGAVPTLCENAPFKSSEVSRCGGYLRIPYFSLHFPTGYSRTKPHEPLARVEGVTTLPQVFVLHPSPELATRTTVAFISEGLASARRGFRGTSLASGEMGKRDAAKMGVSSHFPPPFPSYFSHSGRCSYISHADLLMIPNIPHSPPCHRFYQFFHRRPATRGPPDSGTYWACTVGRLSQSIIFGFPASNLGATLRLQS